MTLNKNTILACFLVISFILLSACSSEESATSTEPEIKPTMHWIGHASVKIKTSEGKVIYIDPWFGESSNYSEPADMVLISHFHFDHSDIKKVTLKEDTTIITPSYDFSEYAVDSDLPGQNASISGITVSAVAAYNDNHSKESSTGYVLEFDGIRLYHAGDTGKIDEMNLLSDKNITYALLGIDGNYNNMNPEEATEAASMINAQMNIPIHTGAPGVYNEEHVNRFIAENKLVLKEGELIELELDPQ
ncbi:MBL fold metallo-hydrolase [Chengkuizengella axinellae]|uniref:MBL fold metallo-hydrolase n=1 Tax=Chengkuizengella axinellae TaxID=3064388 RepID=A0ABT9ITE7_9BACL|nr:MBL fold metallo-hydrolase [Chengkuizengella sp. 2205SS18-9]MDP5272634.1 MBL fold metallo-hydrolase [Chengkuizengella sp. 2205SS18-9]